MSKILVKLRDWVVLEMSFEEPSGELCPPAQTLPSKVVGSFSRELEGFFILNLRTSVPDPNPLPPLPTLTQMAPNVACTLVE